MRTFLSDGRVDLTNNLAERAVKPFAICRRNFLFCKTANGAEAAAVIFTVVQTARLNKLNVEKYLAYVLERIGSADASELMHIEMQKDFSRKMRDICKQTGCQIICATHSPFLADGDERLFVDFQYHFPKD